jgi:hypothetical protein
MGKSEDYWKDRYKQTWAEASSREVAIQEYVQKETGLLLENCGLGTGSMEYLSGSAATRGYAKGGADFHVKGTRIDVEVTGDLTGKVSKTQDLWLRPDKIQDALGNPSTEKWVIHHLAKDQTLRAICLDKEFLSRYSKGEFGIVHPRIRGTVETYVAIPSNDRSVQPVSAFLERLKLEKKNIESNPKGEAGV